MHCLNAKCRIEKPLPEPHLLLRSWWLREGTTRSACYCAILHCCVYDLRTSVFSKSGKIVCQHTRSSSKNASSRS